MNLAGLWLRENGILIDMFLYYHCCQNIEEVNIYTFLCDLLAKQSQLGTSKHTITWLHCDSPTIFVLSVNVSHPQNLYQILSFFCHLPYTLLCHLWLFHNLRIFSWHEDCIMILRWISKGENIVHWFHSNY